MKLHVINGPNLNMLGQREAEHYGKASLADIESDLKSVAAKNTELTFFQSNHEGEIIENIHANAGKDGIIINAASLTHTSVGIRDALLSVKVPYVEVHISNVYAREKFRHSSYLSEHADGVIVGLGVIGYRLALEYFQNK